MKLNRQIALWILCTAGLAGCAISPRENIARSTIEYNLIAEKAGNEMLLLNVVRASKRRPMYFTSFGKLTGSMTYEFGTGNITIPFGRIGRGMDGSYSIAPSVGYKNSPLFDLAVLDTKEFTRGIMMPVPMATVEYYWRQGWPKQMLLHLFIKRIEIGGKNGELKGQYDNDPDDPKAFDRFQNHIRTGKWDIVADADGAKIGEVDAAEASHLKELIEVQKAGLTLASGKKSDTKELRLNQAMYVFTHGGQTLRTDSQSESRVYLRSPEAILYYLGEILRAEDPHMAMIDVGRDDGLPCPARLFYSRKATKKEAAPCVAVEYEGVEYVIPGRPDSDDERFEDRSMHVLSLVSQLVGLQKESEQVPVTGVVNVIGR